MFNFGNSINNFFDEINYHHCMYCNADLYILYDYALYNFENFVKPDDITFLAKDEEQYIFIYFYYVYN